MSLKLNLLALIATILFSITMASVNTTDTTALVTNVSPSASIIPSVNNTLSVIRDPISINCNVNNYDKAYLTTYNDVANHIRNIPGNAILGNQPGGGWCFRYSCSNNLAIYGCNDNQADMKVPWATLAAYADAIREKCVTEKKVHGHWKYVVLGQAFDAGGWNVILGHKSGTNC